MGRFVELITMMPPIDGALITRWEQVGLLENLTSDAKKVLAIYFEEALRFLMNIDTASMNIGNQDTQLETIVFPCLRRLCDMNKLPLIVHNQFLKDRELYLNLISLYVDKNEVVNDDKYYSLFRNSIYEFISCLIDDIRNFMIQNKDVIDHLSGFCEMDVEAEMLCMYCDSFDIKNLKLASNQSFTDFV